MNFDGIILIDKPSGWSSFDVVGKVRNILKQEAGKKVKVGHTGTLDPLATGLMIIVTGAYCKRAQEFSKMDKTYDVTMTLGQTSTTGDDEGEKTEVNGTVPTQDELTEVMKHFVGDSMQTPPTFSAIKINGQRAYKLAREGKEVVIEPRQVSINQITLTDYTYPIATFTVDVGSGTYIRSLVQDIGAQLGTGAYMSGLIRTKVADFELKDAVLPAEVTSASIITPELI